MSAKPCTVTGRDCSSCSHPSSVTSVCQSLDEMDFERGIWAAARDGELEKVVKLLSDGVDPNLGDNFGYTALHYASRGGHLTVCRELVDSGARPNVMTRSGGVTPLHRAAYCGHMGVVEMLLKRGANPAACDADHKTALHKAAEQGHKKVAKMILVRDPTLVHLRDHRGKLPVDYVNDNNIELKNILSI